MAIDNDTRGWIMASISGVACVLGAAVICIDLVICKLPRMENFSIQESNGFLSSALSLSAGVMLFSALASMVPSSQASLQKADFSSKAAAWIMIGTFLGGIIGIQLLSRLFHHFSPSHVVDCDHSHEKGEAHDHHHHHSHHHHHHDHEANLQSRDNALVLPNGHELGPASERSPLLPSEVSRRSSRTQALSAQKVLRSGRQSPMRLGPTGRPSLQSRMTTTVAQLVSDKKVSCDAYGPCYGYTNPCGQECVKTFNVKSSGRQPGAIYRTPSTTFQRSNTTATATHPNLEAVQRSPIYRKSSLPTLAQPNGGPYETPLSSASASPAPTPAAAEDDDSDPLAGTKCAHAGEEGHQPAQEPLQHHHHVPENTFIALSLQTSIAIALHKLPEGFITYATNHANPRLGLSVFLALAIHNLSEGFALALPLYLATSSRIKALLYSLVLGGLSQPLGAGIAALWLALTEKGRGDFAPDEGVYGAMFGVTAGIMCSVAISLLQESFEMTHEGRGLCSVFVFAGMGILGISMALTA